MPSTASDRRSAGRRALAAIVLATGLCAMAACSSPTPSQDDLTAALVDSGLSRKVADCTASALTKSLTSSELAELTERGAGGAPVDDPDTTGESADKLATAMATCRELQVAESPTTTIPIPDDDGANSGNVDTVVPSTDGAQLNPASSTTTVP